MMSFHTLASAAKIFVNSSDVVSSGCRPTLENRF